MGLLNKVSKWRQKARTYQSFILVLTLTLSSAGLAASSKKSWQNTPTPEDWSSFFESSDKDRLKTGDHIKTYGLTFEDLSWEWRLGWVRACTAASSKVCSDIMQLGLFDKALVVRAEAATRLGQRFAGTGHPPALRLLKTAFAVQQNSRSKEPLFVQYRILSALNQIGGEGSAIGKQLSMNSQRMTNYWTRIASK